VLFVRHASVTNRKSERERRERKENRENREKREERTGRESEKRKIERKKELEREREEKKERERRKEREKDKLHSQLLQDVGHEKCNSKHSVLDVLRFKDLSKCASHIAENIVKYIFRKNCATNGNGLRSGLVVKKKLTRMK
jgi:hypothetical protein